MSDHLDDVAWVRAHSRPVTTNAGILSSDVPDLLVLERLRELRHELTPWRTPPVCSTPTPDRRVPPRYPFALRTAASRAQLRAAATHYFLAAVGTDTLIDRTLAPALGFRPYAPGEPGHSEDQVNYLNGDHTAESLALAAADRLTAARAVLAQEDHAEACGNDLGLPCSCWKAPLADALAGTTS